MTPPIEDLILNVKELSAAVHIANKVSIRAKLCGAVQTRIQDLNDPCIACDTLAHDALCVPGLFHRLRSVN